MPEDERATAREVSDTSCPDGNGCFWEQADYGGDRMTVGTGSAGSWQPLNGHDRSAKNRFDNRRIQFGQNLGGGNYQVIGCLNAGNNDSNLGAAIDSFRIGGPGSSC